jgi:hypothetical protein
MTRAIAYAAATDAGNRTYSWTATQNTGVLCGGVPDWATGTVAAPDRESALNDVRWTLRARKASGLAPRSATYSIEMHEVRS